MTRRREDDGCARGSALLANGRDRRAVPAPLRWVPALALVALAAGVGARPANVFDGWIEEVRRIDSLLVGGEHRRAEKASRRLANEIADLLIDAEGARELLGTVAGMRAVAVSGLGDARRAEWFWYVAQQIHPGVVRLDLSRFGPAGMVLDALPPASGRAPLPPRARQVSPTGPDRSTPPRLISQREPRFPPAKRINRDLSVVVDAVIGTDGLPRQPLITEATGELTLVYAVLEAMSDWRFEPATENGEPVESVYVLTVTFRTRR